MRNQAGQILLIVILAIVIASTVGLSLASRSITSLRTSTEEAESQKALSAAEAGIERAIQGNIPIEADTGNLVNNSSYVTSYTEVASSSFLINGGNLIPKNEGADVWFIKHKDDGDLDYSDYSSTSPNFLNLYWGSASESCGNPANMPAAIQAIVITRDPSSGSIKSHKYAYDSCQKRISDENKNNFTSADSAGAEGFTIDQAVFKYRTPQNHLAKNIAGNNNIILMRVIPIYKDTAVGLGTCNPSDRKLNCTPLPSQGYVVTSTGASGNASRKLTVFKGYPQAYLPYLLYGLFVVE